MCDFPTVEEVRRYFDALDADFPDAHADGLNGRGKRIFMAGVMRTGTQPEPLHSLAVDEKWPHFSAQVNACIAFLTFHDLVPNPDIKPTCASLDATVWARVVGGYNIVTNFDPNHRPHVIHPMAFVIAARHLGMAESMKEYQRDEIAPSWPTYAITQKAYRDAGLVWKSQRLPALESVEPTKSKRSA